MLQFIGLIVAICFASAAFAQLRYQITRIPTAQGANSAALGINNKGEVVGYSFQGEDYQAFHYSSLDQSLADVGSIGGKINAACAINDAGQVTGYSQDGNGNLLAFVFSRRQPIISLGTLEGASTSEAFGINNSGAMVGDSQSGNQNHRPVLFSNGSVQDLGIGGSNQPDALETAYAINDDGQIVGRHSVGNNAFHAFVFANGNTTDLGTLGGANGEALAINKNGLVVGDSDTSEGPAHAFVLEHSQLKDLGTLSGFDNASYARAINNSGDIVGESDSVDQKRAFIYTKGQMVELDRLAENLLESGFNSLDVAYGINDKGWIVGYGTTPDDLTAAFVAAPARAGNQGQAGGVPQPQVQRQANPPQPRSQARDQAQPVSESNGEDYDVFYTGLSSDDGNWVEAGNYGYCFRPRVSERWRPYRDGHWIWTDQGWYWDSNERFAWATYHYGRWANIGGTGWCWVPGTQWAPAWVSWRESDQDVGWAPLPPEADVSLQQPISSWSDSYYDIGPGAYAFISYSHWREPNYAQYIEPPRRNLQIFTETKNVTNIVTNNNVINNFGPQVQTVARKTNQNIQQVKLALNPATGPRANYGQTLQGNQLNVVTPRTTIKSQATSPPHVQKRIVNPQVERGWQGVKPQDVEKLKRTIAEQNPAPKDLPKPTPFVNPQIGNKALVPGSHATTGSLPAITEPKTPPNLVKPGLGTRNTNVTPGASPNAAAPGKKPVPPNLLGAKSSVKPGASPTGKPLGAGPQNANVSPSALPNAAAEGKKSVPPNLLGAKSSAKPGASVPEPSGIPTTPGEVGSKQDHGSPIPKPTGNLPLGQNAPHVSATPPNAAAPAEEKKPVTPTAPTPHPGPAILAAPKPPPEAKTAHQEFSTSHPTPVSTPHREAVAPPKPAAEVKATPPPQQEIKTPPSQVQHTPAPQPHARHAPAAQPQTHNVQPPKQEIKTLPPRVQHTPALQPQVRHTPAAQPQIHKTAPPPQVQHAPAPQPQVSHPPTAQSQARKAPPPQGGQKHEPAKGKPTPPP